MTPGGRKKGSKNCYSGEPHNYYYWKLILKNPEHVNAFFTRGSKEQKLTIKGILEYLKNHDKEFFEKINGFKVLEELK